MPEGPEVRRAAMRIGRALGDMPVEQVTFAFEHLREYEAHLSGRRLLAADTRGKSFLLRFEGDLVIYVHLQLYGKWFIRAGGARPKTNRQLRLALDGPDKSALLYSASDISVLPAAAVEHHPTIAKLGPDPLDETTTPALVTARAASKRFRRRKLQGLLLDQGFLAGVGNYLRSEILFEAGVDPSRRPMDCSDAQLEALGEAAVTICRRALAHPGVTTPWPVARSLKAQGQRKRQYRHMVFGRAGQACRICGADVVKIEAAGRRLYLCPDCQQ